MVDVIGRPFWVCGKLGDEHCDNLDGFLCLSLFAVSAWTPLPPVLFVLLVAYRPGGTSAGRVGSSPLPLEAHPASPECNNCCETLYFSPFSAERSLPPSVRGPLSHSAPLASSWLPFLERHGGHRYNWGVFKSCQKSRLTRP